MVRLGLGLLGVAGVLAQDYESLCPLAPEIMVVHDSSKSLKAVGEKLTASLGDILSEWRHNFPGEVRLGLNAFSDKPTPLRGIGHHWIFQKRSAKLDICFEPLQALTKDDTALATAFNQFTWRNGGDPPECQYEALMYTAVDPKTGWTPPKVKEDSEGRKITRIAVVITDDRSHLTGDGNAGIMEYNAPFKWIGNGGWGSPGFKLKDGVPVVMIEGTEYDEAHYNTLSRQLQARQSGSKYDKVLLDELTENFGPPVYGPLLLRNPGTIEGAINNGSVYDYPDMNQLKAGLKQADVIPIVLVTYSGVGPHSVVHKRCIEEFGFAGSKKVAEDDIVPCLKKFYEAELEAAGIHAIVEGFEKADDVTDVLMKAVLSAADFSCKKVDTTTTEEAVVGGGDGDDSTADADASEAEDDSSSDGPNIGVIAGASAGAVAGAAVVAGVLFKKFGAGLFGSQGADVTAVEQVESPDTPLERETLEQVTVDMFQ